MIKNIWKKLSTNEKVMIGFVILMILMVLINWNKISEGVKEGIKPYNKTIIVD